VSKKLKPFSIAGVLNHCPECGATGDYDLLKKKALGVIAVWDACITYPGKDIDRVRLDNTIEQMREVIDMERDK
jgi:hypothetical protein